MVKRISTRPRVGFCGGGRGLAVHAGARLLADLADNVGLTAALSVAMAGSKQRGGGHDRGRVLADAAVMVADGGDAIDIAVWRASRGCSGRWRRRRRCGGPSRRPGTASSSSKRRAPRPGGGCGPRAPILYVVDIDATLVDSHSDKQGAAGTYKRGWGSIR